MFALDDIVIDGREKEIKGKRESTRKREGEKKEADEDRIFRSHLTALRSVAPNGMSRDVAKQTNIDLQSVRMHTRTQAHAHTDWENTQYTSTQSL